MFNTLSLEERLVATFELLQPLEQCWNNAHCSVRTSLSEHKLHPFEVCTHVSSESLVPQTVNDRLSYFESLRERNYKQDTTGESTISLPETW